ncbi:MAG: PorP/SprF family type IX secretion system membrane protein [Imperialibacter sp.]
MKTISLSLMLIFLLNAASGQTLSLKDFYFSAPLFINPAMVGESDDPTFTLIGSVPTSGIDGAPASVSFSYDQHLKTINSGIGAAISRETLGVHAGWRYTLMYNYRWNFSGGNELALGSSFFYIRQESDFSKPGIYGGSSLLAGVVRSNYFSYDLGASYSFFKGTKAGLSFVNYPYNYRENFSEDFSEIKERRKLIAFIQQDFRLSKWLKLTPSALYALPGELPAILNLNATAYIGKWVFVGAQYSNNNSHNNTSNVFAGVCYSDALQIGVKVFEKQSPQAYGYRSAAFMLQVSPKRKSTTAM